MSLSSATARYVFPGHGYSHSNTCDLELTAPARQVKWRGGEPGDSRTRARYHWVMLSATPAEGASWLRWLPGWQTLRHYQRSWLRQDVVAGLVLTSMLLPVGLAYAQASGLPGICGLYATIVPLLAYAIFGPSRILVLGPDSALAPLILAVVL